MSPATAGQLLDDLQRQAWDLAAALPERRYERRETASQTATGHLAGWPRLAQMGLNYNHESNTQVGSWGPSVSTSPTTVSYDITSNVTKGGEIDVSFAYTSGSDGLNVYWVKLLENGTQVDMNTFNGFAGLANYTQTGSSYGGVAYYALHLPWYHPGSTYTIQASVAEQGSNASSNGKVYLPNWN